MSILITGGTGFLGTALANQLVHKDYQNIILLDLKPNYALLSNIRKKVNIVEGNITDWNFLKKLFEEYKITDIFHLAAIASSSKVNEDPGLGFKVNDIGTINLLELSKLFNINRFIFASSIATFGPEAVEPVKEEYCQRPKNLYGITKLVGELAGLYYQREYGLDFRAIRLPRLVNPGRSGEGVVVYPSLMIEEAVTKGNYELELEENFRVPIIFIKDAVNAFYKLYNSKNIQTKIYNISGLIPTAKEIVENIHKYLPNSSIKFSSNPIKSHLPIPLKYDDSKIKAEIGWEIEYTLDKIIKAFIKILGNT